MLASVETLVSSASFVSQARPVSDGCAASDCSRSTSHPSHAGYGWQVSFVSFLLFYELELSVVKKIAWGAFELFILLMAVVWLVTGDPGWAAGALAVFVVVLSYRIRRVRRIRANAAAAHRRTRANAAAALEARQLNAARRRAEIVAAPVAARVDRVGRVVKGAANVTAELGHAAVDGGRSVTASIQRRRMRRDARDADLLEKHGEK